MGLPGHAGAITSNEKHMERSAVPMGYEGKGAKQSGDEKHSLLGYTCARCVRWPLVDSSVPEALYIQPALRKRKWPVTRRWRILPFRCCRGTFCRFYSACSGNPLFGRFSRLLFFFLLGCMCDAHHVRRRRVRAAYRAVECMPRCEWVQYTYSQVRDYTTLHKI